ncbi:MAG: hypothetical protein H0X39_20420 [Actinobacteria bacterium]|nr:hypothetical protein [Actinomycetota bacterium]
MPPESIDADPTTLPRSFHGYDPAATEDLFRRVAWDYGLLVGEHRKLKKLVEGTHLEGQQLQPAAPEIAAPRPAAPRPAAPARDEAAQSLFAAAHKAVREMREEARAECEAALKKAKRRAAEIENHAHRASADAAAVIEAASVLRASLSAALTQLETRAAAREPTVDAAAPDTNGSAAVAVPVDLVRT